jgi:hypothetical protein
MTFPTTEREFTDQGYVFDNKAKCRGCGADIEWWITPKQKHMPVDPGTMIPHWKTCPNAKDFRK